AAATFLLSPYVPLRFMGEEYGETTPFLFFADYGYPGLASAVREGREGEFERFEWRERAIPDAWYPSSFEAARLRWETRYEGAHGELRRWYRDLIALRATPALRNTAPEGISVEVLGDAGDEPEGQGEGQGRDVGV